LLFWLADPATIGRLVRPVSVELTPMLDNVRAGIVGGWAFGKWMAKVNHFPLICSFSGTFAVMDLVWDGDWVTEFSGGFSDP